MAFFSGFPGLSLTDPPRIQRSRSSRAPQRARAAASSEPANTTSVVLATKKDSEPMAKKNAAKKPAKISPSSKPRSKGQFFGTIAEHADLSRKQVKSVFELMSRILAADLSKNGPGVCNVGGLMKVSVVRKPATKERQGINPFTGQPAVFKAKPARNVVKVRPMKALKTMV